MIYRALTNENFYYIEIKNVAITLVNNPKFNKDDLMKYIKENDLIEANNENNFKKKFGTIYKRISSLNSFLIMKLAYEPTDISKFINLLSIILNEKIVFDFINEVIREKYYLMDRCIDNMEFNKFLNEKAEQVEEVRKWSEASKKKIIIRIKNYLTESGYLIKKESRTIFFTISRPLIPMDIIDNIKYEYGINIIKGSLLEK